MANDDWNKAKQIFADAIKIAPAKRSAFLDEVCRDDAETRREVESLLTSLDDAGSFMERPAAHEVTGFIRQNSSLEAGTIFGHYEIIKQIGAGGMGEVYLAKDTKLDRQVAVKILNEKFAAHESNLNRFIQEAKAASALESSEYSSYSRNRRMRKIQIISSANLSKAKPCATISKIVDETVGNAGHCNPDRQRALRRTRSAHRSPRHQTRKYNDSPRRVS